MFRELEDNSVPFDKYYKLTSKQSEEENEINVVVSDIRNLISLGNNKSQGTLQLKGQFVRRNGERHIRLRPRELSKVCQCKGGNMGHYGARQTMLGYRS